MARRVSRLAALGAGGLLGCAVVANLPEYNERPTDFGPMSDAPDPIGDGEGPGDRSVRDVADADTDTGAEAEAEAGPCTTCTRLVFVTSTSYTGDLGGVLGADAKCEARAVASASAAIRAKRFIAWISTAASPAVTTHVHRTEAYKRSDGVLVATGWDDLVDGVLADAIALDELGNLVTGRVWTGTNLNGTSSNATCDAWTSGAVGVIGQQGLAEATTKAWTDETTGTCDSVARLYCIER